MSDCLFCKIVSGAIPNYKVYEDDSVLAFLDVHPCSKGHTVIVPKKHFTELGDMSSDAWSEVMNGVYATMKKVDQVIKPAGFNIGINNRPAAGQAVQHVHWHIIPRYENDGGGSMHSIVRSKDVGDVSEVAKLFV